MVIFSKINISSGPNSRLAQPAGSGFPPPASQANISQVVQKLSFRV
jgi:hypothetical protein